MESISAKELGLKITEIRINIGVNQKEFAKMINSTVSAVSNWENGRNKPNKERMRRIAELSSKTVSELIKPTNTKLVTITDNIKVIKRSDMYEVNIKQGETYRWFNLTKAESLNLIAILTEAVDE